MQTDLGKGLKESYLFLYRLVNQGKHLVSTDSQFFVWLTFWSPCNRPRFRSNKNIQRSSLLAVRKKIGSTIYAAGCFCIDPVNPAYWSNIDTQNLGLHCSVQAENIGVHILFGPVFYESNLPNGAVVFILHNKAFCPFVPSIFLYSRALFEPWTQGSFFCRKQ